MVFPASDTPSLSEQSTVTEQALGFTECARTAGHTLRNVGFQLIAFLLGLALAFM